MNLMEEIKHKITWIQNWQDDRGTTHMSCVADWKEIFKAIEEVLTEFQSEILIPDMPFIPPYVIEESNLPRAKEHVEWLREVYKIKAKIEDDITTKSAYKPRRKK